MIKWFLEPGVFQDDLTPFIEELKKRKVKLHVLEFGKPLDDYVKLAKNDVDVVLTGSFQFARKLGESGFYNGLFCNTARLKCNYYYPRFGGNLLNRDYVMLPFGELKFKPLEVFSQVEASGHVFIRPNSGTKGFPGTLVSRDNWLHTLKLLSLRTDLEDLVLICRPQSIKREWRTIVVDRKIVAASQYKDEGTVVRIKEVPDEVLVYAQNIVDSVSYTPDRAWTLDVCENIKDELKVLEVGSFSCSGFYAAEPAPIIDAVLELMG